MCVVVFDDLLCSPFFRNVFKLSVQFITSRLKYVFIGKKRATKAAHSQLDDSSLHHTLLPQNSTEYGMMLADLQNHEGSGMGHGGAQMHGQK